MKDLLEELWTAVNINCMVLCGQYVQAEYTGYEVPPRPETDEELLRLTIEYLNGTV